MSVIGSYSLTQQLSSGNFLWFLCACSAGSEKPNEAKRYPLWTPGSKNCQHGILVGVSFFKNIRLEPHRRHSRWPNFNCVDNEWATHKKIPVSGFTGVARLFFRFHIILPKVSLQEFILGSLFIFEKQERSWNWVFLNPAEAGLCTRIHGSTVLFSPIKALRAFVFYRL